MSNITLNSRDTGLNLERFSQIADELRESLAEIPTTENGNVHISFESDIPSRESTNMLNFTDGLLAPGTDPSTVPPWILPFVNMIDGDEFDPRKFLKELNDSDSPTGLLAPGTDPSTIPPWILPWVRTLLDAEIRLRDLDDQLRNTDITRIRDLPEGGLFRISAPEKL